MIRLFKLIFIVVILASAYYSFKQHSESIARWQSVTTEQNIKIKFPTEPKHTQKIRDFPVIGQTKLQIYQTQIEDELFVFIESLTRSEKVSTLELNKLETAVYALNGTTGLKITNKRFFNIQSQPAMDYVAHDHNGNLIYCRTFKLKNQLASLIYASPARQFNKKQHKQFVNSLQL